MIEITNERKLKALVDACVPNCQIREQFWKMVGSDGLDVAITWLSSLPNINKYWLPELEKYK